MIFQIIAILLSGWAVVRGFRKGFQYQIPALVGICFGIVCTRIFTAPVAEQLAQIMPFMTKKPEGEYFYDTLASGFIFWAVYTVFSLATRVLRLAFNSSSGMLNSLCGAAFLLFRTLLWLSIALNLIFGYTLNSTLMSSVRSDDGNIVGSVMLLSPVVLGCESCTSAALTLQLHDAKSIS